jgi:hypothetical protein
MRTAVVARAVRSVRENVGGGWGEIDRERQKLRSRSDDRLPEEVVRDVTQDLDVKTSFAARSRNAF